MNNPNIGAIFKIGMKLNFQGVPHDLTPKPDTTAQEAVHLTMLFMTLMSGGVVTQDMVDAYILEHNLLRHFTRMES